MSMFEWLFPLSKYAWICDTHRKWPTATTKSFIIMCLPPLEPPQRWRRPPQSSSLCCAVPELLAHQTAVLSFHHTHCSKRSVRVKRFPFREGVDQPHQLKWMMPVHEWHVSVCLCVGACMCVSVCVWLWCQSITFNDRQIIMRVYYVHINHLCDGKMSVYRFI